MRIAGIKVTAMIALGLATLTACDPPMPPEVLAALAEQSYTCVDGSTEIALPAAIESLGADWQLAVADACPGMDIVPIGAATSTSELEVSTTSFVNKPYLVVPFAVDAAVFAVTLDGISNVNLDAAAIAGILDGSIQSWDDQAIAKINPDYTLPAEPILLTKSAEKVNIDAMKTWMDRLAGKSIDFGVFTEAEAMKSLLGQEGSLILTSYSKAALDGATLVTVLVGKSLDKDLTLPEIGSITAASTQWKVTKSATAISVTLDANKKVIAQEGFDQAVNPYQAIYPVNLALTGTNSLKTRAAAKFLLRQDQQGALAGATMLNLPEAVRVEALTLVSVGLPEPSPLPSN